MRILYPSGGEPFEGGWINKYLSFDWQRISYVRSVKSESVVWKFSGIVDHV